MDIRTKSLTEKRKLHSIVLVGLSLILLGGSVFAGNNDENKPWQKAQENNEMEEIVHMRTRSSKTFSSGNDKGKLFTTPSSIHYDKNGTWEEISLDITSNNSGEFVQYPYAALENSYKTYYPADLNNQSPVLIVAGNEIKERVNALYFSGNGLDMSKIEPQQVHSSTLESNSITYSNYFQGADLKYTQLNDARKMDVVIQNKSFLNNVPQGVEHIEISEVIELPIDWYLQKSEHGLSIFSKSKGAEVAFIPNPSAVETQATDKNYDSETDLMVFGKLSFEEIEAGKYEIRTAFPINWLLDKSRNFPVSLDPTINVSPMLNSNFWTGRMTSAFGGKFNGFIRVANTGSLGWAKFDLSSVPPAVLFLDAVYHGYHYTGSINNGSKFSNIVGLEAVDPVTATNTAIAGQINTGPNYNNNYIFGGNGVGWYDGQIDPNALPSLAAEADNQGWTALGFDYASGNAGFMYHHGNNAASDVCYLEIEYIFPDDAGIASIETPGIPECLNNDLYVKITTISPDPVTSVRIEWTVNGVNQTPLNWTGFLPPASTTPQPVYVGDFNFQQGDVVKVWTTNPNGLDDKFPDNDTATFTIPSFTTSNMATEELLCPGESITLSTGVGFAAHQWSTGAGLPQISVSQGGIYEVTITDNNSGCQHDYQINVIEDNPVNLPDTTVWGCSIDGGITLQGNKLRANYLWSNGTQGTRITVTQSGTYWVQATDPTQTCLSSDTVDVEIYDLPNPSFTQNRDYLTLIFTNNTQDADSYLWDFGDGQSSTDFEPTHLYVQPGNYTVRLTAFNLCGQRSTNEIIGVDPVGVGNIENLYGLNLYPNPSSGQFNVDFKTDHLNDVQLQIMDMQGRLIQTEQLGDVSGNFSHQVHLNNVASGIYLVKITTGTEVISVERVTLK